MKLRIFWLFLLLSTLAFGAAAQENPHAPTSAMDRVEPAPDLPHGTLEAQIVDASGQPLVGHDVKLGILYQKVAEGESRSSRDGKTGPNGMVRFDGLETATAFSYRLAAKLGPAEYASQPFSFRDTGGMRVVLHVYPATTDVSKAVLGMRGFFYIETRDDVFQVEVLFRVMNLGKNAWVPENAFMDLPAGFKAFSADATSETRFEAVEGRGARLVGTYPPGQRDVSFRFQVPKPAETTVTFRSRPPPHTVEMRVIAVANKNMTLSVEDWEPTQESTGPRGDHVLVTRKIVARGAPEVGPFVVTLAGLPVPGSGRWVATGIALVFALCGGAAAAGKLRVVSSTRAEGDRARARELLLSELVTLELARARKEVGPSAYERTRRALSDALARIGLPSDARRPRERRRRASTSASTG